MATPSVKHTPCPALLDTIMPKKPKKPKARKTKNLFHPFSRDENGLNLICQIPGLQDDTSVPVEYQDAVLVSIDFENLQAFDTGKPQSANVQVGIAILDTRAIDVQA